MPRSVKDLLASHHANATGTLEVLQAARRAGNIHTIVASSSSVYGAEPRATEARSDAYRPLSPYAVSKLATESYALSFGQTYDLPVLTSNR